METMVTASPEEMMIEEGRDYCMEHSAATMPAIYAAEATQRATKKRKIDIECCDDNYGANSNSNNNSYASWLAAMTQLALKQAEPGKVAVRVKRKVHRAKVQLYTPTGSDPTIQELALGLMSDNHHQQARSLIKFRRLLMIEDNTPIDEIIDAGVIPLFVEFLGRSDNHDLQFQAAEALTNICSGTSKHVKVVLESGAVPALLRLLNSPVSYVKEQAIWAIGNIAGDGPFFRDYVLHLGVIPLLMDVISSAIATTTTATPTTEVTTTATNNALRDLVRRATWTLSNLHRGKVQPDFAMLRPALPLLSELLLHHQDEQVIVDACWCISYYSAGGNTERIQAVIDLNIMDKLVDLLRNDNKEQAQNAALTVIGNIAFGNVDQTQLVIDSGALRCFKRLMTHPKKTIRKEVFWSISNIAAGNQSQIQAIIDHGFIPKIVHMLTTSTNESGVCKEAVWAISNATSAVNTSPQQIRCLVESGCIQALVNLLDYRNDDGIVALALQALDNILQRRPDEYPDAQRFGAEAMIIDGSNNTIVRVSPYVALVEEAGGVDKMISLVRRYGNSKNNNNNNNSNNSNHSTKQEICMAAMNILTQYFFNQTELSTTVFATVSSSMISAAAAAAATTTTLNAASPTAATAMATTTTTTTTATELLDTDTNTSKEPMQIS